MPILSFRRTPRFDEVEIQSVSCCKICNIHTQNMMHYICNTWSCRALRLWIFCLVTFLDRETINLKFRMTNNNPLELMFWVFSSIKWHFVQRIFFGWQCFPASIDVGWPWGYSIFLARDSLAKFAGWSPKPFFSSKSLNPKHHRPRRNSLPQGRRAGRDPDQPPLPLNMLICRFTHKTKSKTSAEFSRNYRKTQLLFLQRNK